MGAVRCGGAKNSPDYIVEPATGRTYRILADHLGSPRVVLDAATGEVVQRMDFDAFGRVVHESGDLSLHPFGFAGGLYDRDTGLVRFGARDYDPYAGRWTARDPILFGGEQANLYAYVGNDPVNATDPTGLLGWKDVLKLIRFWFEIEDATTAAENMRLCRSMEAQVTDELLCGEQQDAEMLQERIDEWCPGVRDESFRALGDIAPPYDSWKWLKKNRMPKLPKPPLPKPRREIP